MNQLIFQASRHHLCSQISTELEKASDPQSVEILKKVLAAADEEIRSLEYWSDLRKITDNGETMTVDTEELGLSGGKGKSRMP